MERLSNRHQSVKSEVVTQYVYVEKEVPIEVKSAAEIQYVDREVIREVPVETVVIQKEIEKVDLSEINAHIAKHEEHFQGINRFGLAVQGELEMQRRALVGLKAQRDVDRKRRLTFIKRIKKEQDNTQRRELKLKLAIGASLLLAVISLIIKL